jgi:plasmid maintenance system killer protein
MTERERLLKIQEAEKELFKTSLAEMNQFKKKNPGKIVAGEESINSIASSLSMKMSENGEMKQEDATQSLFTALDINNATENANLLQHKMEGEEEKIRRQIENTDNIKVRQNYEAFSIPKTTRKFDIVPLVSKGECYPHKKTRIAVYYMTAREENLVTSLNLYRSGLLADSVLQSTIAEEGIDPDDLIQADRDAILLFLRGNAYGPEFPVEVENPFTGKPFSTNILLTQIEYRDFTLKGDENGWFDYKTADGENIKFSFPNRREERYFEKMVNRTEKNVQQIKLSQMLEDLRSLSSSNFEELSQTENDSIDTACNLIESVRSKLSVNNGKTFYSNVLTELMIMTVREVNGNRDRAYIRDFIENMQAGEARKFRKHVDANTPSLDYTVEITIPQGEPHAGETFKNKLIIDDTLFINIAD